MTAIVDPQSILDERARRLAVPPDDDAALTEPHLVLRVGDHHFTVPVARIRHVSGPKPIAAVPSTAAAIVGIAPILGALVTVVDLGPLVGAHVDHPNEECQLVVVDDGDEALALLVDHVDDLVELVPDQSDPVSGQLTSNRVGGPPLLRIDGLLADPRLSHVTSSSDPPRGEP